MSISFSSIPEEQEEHVKGLLNEGLFEFLLFSLGCDQYQINTFQSIEDQILRKDLKEIKFENISQTKLNLKKSTFISYKSTNTTENEIITETLNEMTEIGLKYVKENVEYWNVFDDSIKLNLNILNVLILQKTNDKLFVSNILTMIVTKEKKRLKEYIEIIKIIISIDPTLINLLPLDLQLNYNILQIIFEKDILNCIKYLSIGILDSFKMLIFDSVKINERKYILQQFKERYNNELKNTNN
ncbi:hypothetical protein ABK040_002540 [Willaertia magna]